MDCHNRPSHAYDLPERGVDNAMAAGSVSGRLPFAKKKARGNPEGRLYAAATRRPSKIPAAFIKYYQETYPAIWAQRQAEVTASGPRGAGHLEPQYLPGHECHLGHVSDQYRAHRFPGLLPLPRRRAHNATDGKSITQDCNACHNLLAMDEANPKILTDLGIEEPKAK